MKTYKLTILYMAGNTRSEDVEVKADHLSISDGALIFYDRNNERIACYPTHCTILKEIKNY